ncbi:MAG: hypothetical protein SGBAC_008793 [Bacillariaceae sp.]
MTVEMTTAHFDDTLETVLSASFCGIVFCAMWLIIILVDIEASKVAFFTVDATGKDMDLQLDVTTDDANTSAISSNGMEVESGPHAKTNEPEIKASRGQRVSFQFKLMQLGSVALLILLTYLLLVTSNASWWLSALGALSVFGMFLRFQVGDELRRQRWDRLTLMVSLLLLIAAFLNLSTYAWKALAQGEIYMGPARILQYDMGAFNNTKDGDITTRTNLVVQWGSDWGCPFSGGKVCEADVQGVMCAVKPGGNRRRIQSRNLFNEQSGGTHTGGNKPANNHHPCGPEGNGQLGDGEHGNSNSTNNGDDVKLEKEEKENQDLEKENEELKEEVETLKEKNDEEIDEMYDGEAAVEEEMLGEELEEDVEIINTNEEKEEALADEDEMEEQMEKNVITDELKNTNDDSVQSELEKDLDLLDEEQDETKKDLDAVLDADSNLADEYEDFADEVYDEAVDEFDVEIDEMFDEEDANTDLDEIEAEIDETEGQLDSDKGNTSQQQHSEATDEWTWDDMSFEYDDDIFENEYWNYDWDSAWGEYGCGDLFQTDISGQVHDPSIPAGNDDSWPYINIYGSCKYCDAYVLDYFAEETFEKLDNYVIQGVMFMGLAFTGILISFVGFVKYKLSPPAENQIDLLGSEAGVIA